MVHRVECTNSALQGLRILDIVSDRHFPRHAHDQFGVGLMLSGGHISWSGRGQVEAGPNHVITVSPNEIHDGIPIQGAPRRWRMLFVDPRVISEIAGVEMAMREFTQPAIANLRLARHISSALDDLQFGTTGEALESVIDLFGALLDSPENSRSGLNKSIGVQRMLERIHDDPVEAPSLTDLADVSGLTPYTALRRFRRELGTTPHAYLVQYRVRRAFKEISAGATLAEAAQRAGFADQSHMTRLFSRQFGVTPGQWRSTQNPSRQS